MFFIFPDFTVASLLTAFSSNFCNICIPTRNSIRLLILSCLFVLNSQIFLKELLHSTINSNQLKRFRFLSAPFRFTCGVARRPGRRPQQRRRRWPASGERTRRSARRTADILQTAPDHRHHPDAPGVVPGP